MNLDKRKTKRNDIKHNYRERTRTFVFRDLVLGVRDAVLQLLDLVRQIVDIVELHEVFVFGVDESLDQLVNICCKETKSETR